jgi:flavin reductase (DIM6/NTAB) family NADH-FMN oxidoreductase RutF
MARKSFKAGALTAPLPPVMVTVGDMENSNVITIGWTGILSTIPPRTYISVRPERHSYKLLKATGEFVINLTTASQARTVDYVGIYTGAKVNKFEKLGLTAVPSECVAPPTIKESPLSLECRVFDVLHFGTHDVFMADIVNVSCDESLLDERGKICFDRAGLMAYAHGEYYALGEKIGKFGFSAASTREAQGYAERSQRKLCEQREGKPRKAAEKSAAIAAKPSPVSDKKHHKKGGRRNEKAGKR